eukprot:COSAG03_NODE_14284_length_469_cov_42.729730_1_plen_52_part_10
MLQKFRAAIRVSGGAVNAREMGKLGFQGLKPSAKRWVLRHSDVLLLEDGAHG